MNQTKEETIELAKKCGIMQRHLCPDEFWCYEHQLLAYTSAIESSLQAEQPAEKVKQQDWLIDRSEEYRMGGSSMKEARERAMQDWHTYMAEQGKEPK